MQHKNYSSRSEDEYSYHQGAPVPPDYSNTANVYWPYPHPGLQASAPPPAGYAPSTSDAFYYRNQAQHPLPEGASHHPGIPAAAGWSAQAMEGVSPVLPMPDSSPNTLPHVHEWTESKNTTLPKAIEPLILEIPDRSGKRFYCGWIGCNHSGGFVRKAQLITHIRSVHLSEKPFICKACDASFTRRQDAVRHVETMNSGKQYKCHYCDEGFARKDYRERHSDRCKCRTAKA